MRVIVMGVVVAGFAACAVHKEHFIDPIDNGCHPLLSGDLGDRASCDTRCSDLPEASCLTAPGCRATYLELDPSFFVGCREIAPSGPASGRCQGLSAQACSRRDDCAAHYIQDGHDIEYCERFSFCDDEPTVGQNEPAH